MNRHKTQRSVKAHFNKKKNFHFQILTTSDINTKGGRGLLVKYNKNNHRIEMKDFLILPKNDETKISVIFDYCRP